MKTGDELNEYGTPVSAFKCEFCGEKFTVCPKPKNDDDWKGCLSDKCISYDPGRDADKYFGGTEKKVIWN